MEKVTQGRDIFRNALLGSVQSSAVVHNAYLAAGVAQAYSIPAGANLVIFSASNGADFYCKIKAANTAIAVPGANITDGSAPEINPSARSIRATDAYICLISPSDCNISMSFFGAEVRV